ncbi:unnamed protein product [Meloidogyne enterolobii]|uniref:Uncharacterized protein n=1 Tax=Meloidogyne enterolobii TaxID=390850 RepID=A0ACB0XU82_MELEN
MFFAFYSLPEKLITFVLKNNEKLVFPGYPPFSFFFFLPSASKKHFSFTLFMHFARSSFLLLYPLSLRMCGSGYVRN